MDNCELSICIPTYNRSNGVFRLVSNLLLLQNERIEIVVMDNGSTDDTLDLLGTLDDDRLRVYTNGSNKGVLYNILNVLDKAKGTFSVLLLDKDNIDSEQVADFAGFLIRNPSLACGYCEYNSPASVEAEIEPKGIRSLSRIAYICHHPSGYFFKTSLLKSIKFTERFSDFGVVGHFPFDFIFAELLLLGDGAIYHRALFSPESLSQAAQHKSIGTNASREDAFFSPPARLNTAINFCRHINTLDLIAAHKRYLIVDRFIQGLIAATVGFRGVMNSSALCAHYHIASRRVGVPEMINISARFYMRFVRDVVFLDSMSKFRSVVGFNSALLLRISSRVLSKLRKSRAIPSFLNV